MIASSAGLKLSEGCSMGLILGKSWCEFDASAVKPELLVKWD